MDEEPENISFNKFQAWMTAIRARTIPIPTIQVLTGTALAYSLGGINWLVLLFTWLIAVLITLGTNLINDVFDFEKGGDQPKRAGHVKMITAGMISKHAMFIAGISFFALAILLSVPLAMYAGWGVFFLVVVSAIIGYCYTGGPYPLSYLGLSEIFILVFYGFICVGAAFYLQRGYATDALLLCAFQMGLLAILPNALNNFRDMHDDEKVNKLTVAVRFGEKFARLEIVILTILPFVLNFYWLSWGYTEAGFLPLLFFPIALYFVHSVWKTPSGPRLNPYFPLSVFIHFGFGLLLCIGFLLKD